MRKWICVPMMTLCLLLGSCGGAGKEEMSLRQAYLDMSGCEMEADVTCGAGTEDALTFSLRCQYVPGKESGVEILSPETVAGIRAAVSGDTASVVYEELCLPAGTLGRAEISPAACLPWLMDALRDGWLLEESREEVGGVPCIRLCLDESVDRIQAEAIVWLRQDDGSPVRGEVCVDGEIILTAEFTEFRFCDTINHQTGEAVGDTDG